MSKRISIETADVLELPCDVLVLKYAQGFYGVDRAVFGRLKEELNSWPEPEGFVLLPSKGAVAAKKVLFVGVSALHEFDYPLIREFATTSLSVLGREVPDASRIAMTIHGVGYGLDEREAFLAQIAGILDAFSAGYGPSTMEEVVIVEQNRDRASRLRTILKENLPSEFSDEPKTFKQIARITAGTRSRDKPHVFVAMPFNDEMEDVYVFGIQQPVNEAGFLCERADMTTFTGDILARIKSRIETAALVIADLTGANPNVYLEVGYAWGKDRSTLLLSKQSDELKFDVRGQRTLVYKSISDLAKKLEADLAALK